MTKKKPLTEEQKHKIRVAAAKKAAKTRKANIPEALKKAKAAEKRAKTMAKKRKALMEEAYQRNLAAKKKTAAWQKRSSAAKKGWETRRAIDRGKKVIESLRKMIDNWAPDPHWSAAMASTKTNDRNSLQNMLDSAIRQFGEKEVAKRIEADADQNLGYADTILWDSNDDRVDSAKAHLISILNSGPVDAQQAKDIAEKYSREEMEEAEAELDFLLG